jgi:hypothetical protein
VQHQHVRLLDQLRPGHPVPAQQQIGRHRRDGDVADQQRLQAVDRFTGGVFVAGEVQAGVGFALNRARLARLAGVAV